MNVRDMIGKRGEAIAMARLLTFCGERDMPLFDPHPLGEKCPTFDFLVELVGAEEDAHYFLVQVKATRQGRDRDRSRLPVSLKAEDVRRMVRCPIPSYVIGVDELTEQAFVLSVDTGRDGSITSMTTAHLLDESNLLRLRDEVRDHWNGARFAGGASFFVEGAAS